MEIYLRIDEAVVRKGEVFAITYLYSSESSGMSEEVFVMKMEQ